jgi:hypothetical protein
MTTPASAGGRRSPRRWLSTVMESRHAGSLLRRCDGHWLDQTSPGFEFPEGAVARPALPSGIGLGRTRQWVSLLAQARHITGGFMQTIERATPEQLAKRKANLERKQRQRAREKARSFKAIQEHLERVKGDEMNAEGIVRRTKRNQCTLGETSPGVDARTVEEALEVAREFARALSIPDVQEGESLYDFERRVFDAWTNYEGFRGGYNSSDGGGAPYLNRLTVPGAWKDLLGRVLRRLR